MDGGNSFGVKRWVSYDTCETFCREYGCNSFVHCTMSTTDTGDCWLKQKILEGNEPTKDTSGWPKCTTYYNDVNGK